MILKKKKKNTVKVYIFGRVLYVCVYIYIHTHKRLFFN